MIEPQALETLTNEVRSAVDLDRIHLETMRQDVRPLRARTRRIQPRPSTAISLVGTDGGNNRLEYDPFLLQLIRVVDSSENEYCLEAISANTSFETLRAKHIDQGGNGVTPLGKMMNSLGMTSLQELSPVFRQPDPLLRSPSWVQVYREMTEWAVMLSLVRDKDFATDTVIVFDGFLRSKMFAKGKFQIFRRCLETAITAQYTRSRRRIYVVGVAKHSKVLQKYRLAMTLEGVMRNTYPCYVDVDSELEQKAYRWSEYASGGGEGEGFVAGKMHFVKFGGSPNDPIWAIDLLISQASGAQLILGHLLADAILGFPIPLYPLCLQKAHEKAAIVDFDRDILQGQILDALRDGLGSKAPLIDELALQEGDISGRRYQ